MNDPRKGNTGHSEFQSSNPVYISLRQYKFMIKDAKTMIAKLIGYKIRFLSDFLFRIAMSDGILSDEEINILSSIFQNLDLLLYAVINAYEDNVIDEYEISQFERIIAQIGDQAISTAKFDDCITDDDGRLIKILQISLIEFQKILLR